MYLPQWIEALPLVVFSGQVPDMVWTRLPNVQLMHPAKPCWLKLGMSRRAWNLQQAFSDRMLPALGEDTETKENH